MRGTCDPVVLTKLSEIKTRYTSELEETTSEFSSAYVQLSELADITSGLTEVEDYTKMFFDTTIGDYFGDTEKLKMPELPENYNNFYAVLDRAKLRISLSPDVVKMLIKVNGDL